MTDPLRTPEELKIHKVLDWIWTHKSRIGNQVEWYNLVEELVEQGVTHRSVCLRYRELDKKHKEITPELMRKRANEIVTDNA